MNITGWFKRKPAPGQVKPGLLVHIQLVTEHGAISVGSIKGDPASLAMERADLSDVLFRLMDLLKHGGPPESYEHRGVTVEAWPAVNSVVDDLAATRRLVKVWNPGNQYTDEDLREIQTKLRQARSMLGPKYFKDEHRDAH